MQTPTARMPPHRPALPAWLSMTLALAAIAAATVWRFSPWTHQYFYGDDLDYLLSVRAGECATRAADILTHTCQQRFRPVASGFVLATIQWFGPRMGFYNVVNFLIQFLIAGLAFACARRLSGGRLLVSAIVGVVVATSRFALYGTTQAIGPVESLALATTLLCLYSVLRFDGGAARLRWAIAALAAAFLAINTHERFVVLAVWLSVAMLSSPAARSLSRRTLAALFLACVALPAIYIGYKTLVLDTTFLIGTGGTQLAPDPVQVLRFAGDAAWSLFGFNQGPAYLVGRQPQLGANVETLAGVGLAGSWAALLLLGAVYAWSARQASRGGWIEAVRWPLLLLVLAAFVLFPALLTIRLEHRWLMAPFALLMLVAAWSAGRVAERKRGVATVLACMLGVSSVATDSMAMRGYDQVFLVSSAHFADLVKRDILDADPSARGPIRLVAEDSHCRWTLRDGRFFAVYGKAAREVHCYASLEDAIEGGLPPGTGLFSLGADDKLADLTTRVEAMSGGNDHAVVFDFLDRFDAGKINDARHVDTPTGRGVLRLPWESTLGQRDTLIVLSGFRYRFEDVAVPAGASFRFGVSMLYPARQSARLVITATLQGAPARTLLSLDLVPPSPSTQAVDFQQQSIDLSAFAGSKVAFEFSVQSPGGDSTAHWVGLMNPVIVEDAAGRAKSP